MIKTSLILIAILCGGLSVSAQKLEKKLLGTWRFLALEHFNANGELDPEATAHFSELIQNRTMTFKKDSVLLIPSYAFCQWYTSGNELYIRYSKGGAWDKQVVNMEDKHVMGLLSEIDVPEPGNTHRIVYVREE
jgi:hypothetical protein